MTRMTRSLVACAMLTSGLLAACGPEAPPPPKVAVPPIVVAPPLNEQMKRLAQEVYVYAYPLVLMDVTRQIATAKVPVASMIAALPESAFTPATISGGSKLACVSQFTPPAP